MSEKPNPTAVMQRIRNRIIEYLDLAASFDDQVAYQAAVPAVHVPHEVINQWEDWVQPNWRDHFGAPVFSPDEIAAIGQFHQVWSTVTETTPNPLPPIERLFDTLQWQQLASASATALAVFQKRGKLPEGSDA